MTTEDCNYIWQQSKLYKELMALRQISIQLKDYEQAAAYRLQAVDIQNELYVKYKIII